MINSFIRDLHTTITTEYAFLRDFLVILKHALQNYLKIMKKCILGTACILIMFKYSTKSVFSVFKQRGSIFRSMFYIVLFDVAFLTLSRRLT